MVVDSNDRTVTLKCGRLSIPAFRDKGIFIEAKEPDRTHTKDYAKERARKHVDAVGNVFLAKARGVYKGPVVELTPTFAIQKINSETAILHRLKDLESAPGAPIPDIEGQNVRITREAVEKGGVAIEPWSAEQEREERDRDKIRERERSRGGQSR
jgi:hypothetical protein